MSRYLYRGKRINSLSATGVAAAMTSMPLVALFIGEHIPGNRTVVPTTAPVVDA